VHKPPEAGNNTSGKLGNWRYEFLTTQEIGMLYNRHSDTELERAVYIDPANTAARDELIARIPALLDNRSDQLQEAEMMLEVSEREHKSEIANMEEELHVAERHATELQAELDTVQELREAGEQAYRKLEAELIDANAQIAQLTRAEDLV
jgi:chromosome segregation ATPase